MSRRARLLVLALAALAAQAAAQEDLTAPPRLDPDAEPPAARPTPPRNARSGRPGETRLAEIPDERREALDEIVITGEQTPGLPDLGSSLRAEREAEAAGRLHVRFLPLYDPEDPLSMSGSLFPLNREMQRVGYLELFRIRFGGRRLPDGEAGEPQ